MGSNVKTPLLIKETFLQAIHELEENYTGSSLTDIFITVDTESGEVAFYDDEENILSKIVIYDWINNTELTDEKIATILREITEEIDNDDKFAGLDLYKPFSVIYADDNMNVIEELLTIEDDSAIQIDNDLLEKFDREFDAFLDKLLKE